MDNQKGDAFRRHSGRVALQAQNALEMQSEPEPQIVQSDSFTLFDEITLGKADPAHRPSVETISLALCVEAYLSGKPLTSMPKEVLLCALSACRWGLHFSGNASEELQPKLEEVLFKERETKLSFLKDTIEPGLEVGEEHVSGLHRVTTEEQFADVLPELAVEWLARFEEASEGAVWSILKAAVRFIDRAEIADLVETRLQKGEWASDEHRCAWHAAAFALDFSRFHSALVSFSDESDEHLWAFKAIISDRRTEEHISLQLSVEQLHFLIDRFAPRWPVVSPPNSGWSGSNNSWDATNWIIGLINLISDRETEDAIAKLKPSQTLDAWGNTKTMFYTRRLAMCA